MPSEPRASPSWSSVLPWIAALAVVAFAVYGANLDDYFVADDFDFIVSFYGKPASYFFELLYHDESGDVWASMHVPGSGYLRPLKIWMLRLDLALWGTWAPGFHITATAAFALLVIVSFLIGLELFPEHLPFVFIGACGLAMHPTFSQIVPVITFREDTLAAGFGLAAFLLFLAYRRKNGSAWWFYACYVPAILSKESGIAAIALPAAYDLVTGLAAGDWRQELRRRFPFYLPACLLVPAYFSLRWFAFGSAIGDPTSWTGDLLSPAAWMRFHSRFLGFMFHEWMFTFHELPFVELLALALVLAGLVVVLRNRRRLGRDYFVALVFVGPGWYLASTAILLAVYFDPRHNIVPLVGLALFLALLAAGVTRVLGLRPLWPALGLLLAAEACFLKPTLALSREYSEASHICDYVRAEIERRTAHLPPGSAVLLENVPQAVDPPYFFGWGLRSALMLPFTKTGLANHSQVIDYRNIRINAYPYTPPERFDAVVRFEEQWPAPRARLWMDRE